MKKPDNKKAVDAPRTNLFLIDPDELTLVEDENDPLYDPRVKLPLDENLMKNMMVFGNLEPIIGRKVGEKVVVVDGRQRVKAARAANVLLAERGKELIRMKVCMYRGTSTDTFGVMISTNENRTDDGPLARAEKMNRYMSMGRTEDEAAVAFGVNVQTINTWLKLLDLSVKLRRAVERGQVSASAAVTLSTLSPEDQDAALDELKSDGPPTAERARQMIGRKVGSKSAVRPIKEIRAMLDECAPGNPLRPGLEWVLRQDGGPIQEKIQ